MFKPTQYVMQQVNWEGWPVMTQDRKWEIHRLKNTLIYNNINSRPKEAKSMNFKRQRQRGAHKNKHDKSVWSLGLYVEVSLTII